ncbi:MAG: hypothetical protein NWE86_06660 [Candidatus Bathyarchaeota archaeon]|nr:hypothetical protein [Candidatus Bathyarchaeota archaeon]
MKKLGLFIAAFLTIILVFSVVPNANASPDIIYSDPEDGIVGSNNFVNNDVINVGDTSLNVYFRGFVKFSLSGVSGSISSATLNLYLWSSYSNGAYDSLPNLTNPGLGDLQVIHIADYGTLSSEDFDDTSIGNDPGVLISGSATPPTGYISIDITAAMQDDIDNGRAFTSFLIKLATDTDGTFDTDNWGIRASEYASSTRAFVEYELAPENPVGGIYAPNNKLNILVPYIALVGLIGAISSIFVIVKKRRA